MLATRKVFSCNLRENPKSEKKCRVRVLSGVVEKAFIKLMAKAGKFIRNPTAKIKIPIVQTSGS